MTTDTSTRAMQWTPRILGILYAAFVSLFALDVFGQGTSFSETIVGLLIHLVPTYIIVAALVVGWRWPVWGGIAFVASGIAFNLFFQNEWAVTLLLTGPLFLIGALFLLDAWLEQRALRPRF